MLLHIVLTLNGMPTVGKYLFVKGNKKHGTN